MDDPNAPKYLNTPQTLLYDKGRHVFGLSQAKESIRKSDYAVVVEGNLDVVSSHQAGIRQVVATAGTAMTENHLRALKRLTGNVRLAFDGDKAGIAATERAIPIASEVGLELTIITLPGEAKDPDELIQQDPALWQKAIDTAQPAVDWILEQYAQREDVATASGKRAFTTAGLNVVRGLGDPVEREHYEKKIARMVGTSLEAVKEKLAAGNPAQPRQLKPIVEHPESLAPTYDHIDTVLGLALMNPRSHDLFDGFDPQIFSGEAQKAVASYLGHPHEVFGETPKELQKFDDYVKIILLRAEKRYGNWAENDQYMEIAKLLRQYKSEYEKQRLEQQINDAEQDGNAPEVERLRKQHYELIKEMKRGQR